jgi:hypothetical protein
MRIRPTDTAGTPARHGIVQIVDTVSKAAGVASAIYQAGRTVLPYVRPVLTALAAAAL